MEGHIRKKVSILLPVRNARDTLDDCLQSIVSQSLDDFELIIVDDGSSDGSTEYLQQWAQRDARIKLIVKEANGLVSALNTGLEQVFSPYIARMDADDVMHKDRLLLQTAYMEQHPEIGLVACQVKLFPETAILKGYREYIRWQNQCLHPQDIELEMFVESPLAHPSVMFRRSVVQELGGYEHGDFPEDYELWLRLMHAGVKMAKLPQVLLYWRERENRTSRTDYRYQRSRFDWLRAEYLCRYPALNRARTLNRPIVYWGAGRKTRQRSGLLIQKGFAPRAWIDIDPRKIGNHINGAPVQPVSWLRHQAGTDAKPFVLSYVTNHGARELIAGELHQYGYKRGEDYLMVG